MSEDKTPYQAFTSNIQQANFFTIENLDNQTSCFSYSALLNTHLLTLPNRNNRQILGFIIDKDIIALQGLNLQEIQLELMRWNISKLTCYDPSKHQLEQQNSTAPIIEKIAIKSRFSGLVN